MIAEKFRKLNTDGKLNILFDEFGRMEDEILAVKKIMKNGFKEINTNLTNHISKNRSELKGINTKLSEILNRLK